MFDSGPMRGAALVILGIDPGLANTGWGVVEHTGSRLCCIAYGCIDTPATAPLPERLSAIHDQLRVVVSRYRPAECAVESVFFSTNAKTAFLTGQARGAAILATADMGAGLGEYGPGEIKMAVTGNGSADKRQMQYMVRTILGLNEDPDPEHAADALAAAICHAHARKARMFERKVPR